MFWIFLLFLISSASAFETSSDEISFDLNKKVCVFEGNCEIKFDLHGEGTFRADHIEVQYKDKDLKKPERIDAKKNISFQNNDIKILAETCSFDMKVLKFSKNIVIENSEFGEVTADEASYNIETKKLTISAKNKVKVKLNDGKSDKILRKIKK